MRRADEIRAVTAEHVDVEARLSPELQRVVRIVAEAVLREVAAVLEEEGL